MSICKNFLFQLKIILVHVHQGFQRGPSGPLGCHYRNLEGHKHQKETRGRGGAECLSLKLTLDILELMRKSKKKVGFYLVVEGHSFFNFFKGGLLKKSLGNPVVHCIDIKVANKHCYLDLKLTN